MNRQREVCRDFKRGSCRFGARCRFIHETSQKTSPFGFGSKSQSVNPYREGNYYSSLSETAGAHRQPQPQLKEHKCIDPRLCKEQIKEDFQNEQPAFWRLTCYAHWKYLPNDIVGDISFEELRSLAYEDAKRGLSLRDVIQRERMLFSAKNAEFENLLKNPYRGPAATSTTFLGAESAQNSQGTQLLFGKHVSSVTLLPSTPFGQVTTAGPADFSFGKDNSMVPLKPGNQFAASTPPAFAFQNVTHGFTSRASQQDISGSPYAAMQTQLMNNGSNFQLQTANVPTSISNVLQASRGPFSAEMMNIEIPAGSTTLSSYPSLQQVSSLAGKEAFEKKYEDDKWLKESWKLGEIPEEEPPSYA